MKKIKRALATVLCCAMIFGVCVPFASAESEPITEITQEMPEQVVEKEKKYSDKLEEIFNEGVVNLERGGLTLASFLVSPIVILFPMTSAVGIILLTTGLPVGIERLLLGTVEIIGSPIIALFS